MNDRIKEEQEVLKDFIVEICDTCHFVAEVAINIPAADVNRFIDILAKNKQILHQKGINYRIQRNDEVGSLTVHFDRTNGNFRHKHFHR